MNQTDIRVHKYLDNRPVDEQVETKMLRVSQSVGNHLPLLSSLRIDSPGILKCPIITRLLEIDDEYLIENMNKRFEAVDKRFEDLTGQMNHRFTTSTWMIGVGFVVITSLTTVFAVLA